MTETSEQLWKGASTVLQRMLNPDMYSRWFAPIKPVEIKNDVLVLAVANEFSQIWLQDNFLPLVREAVNQSSRHPVQVRFAVEPGTKAALLPAKKSRSDKPSPPSRPPLDIKLNQRYTFDTFVVGPNNSFAHAAALAVAQSPAKAYNPLFVYGGVGLGKTHLMQAIGQTVVHGKQSSKVVYLTSEQFINEYIQAIQTASITRFRKKYRAVDVLLIDDIQFLAGKERG